MDSYQNYWHIGQPHVACFCGGIRPSALVDLLYQTAITIHKPDSNLSYVPVSICLMFISDVGWFPAWCTYTRHIYSGVAHTNGSTKAVPPDGVTGTGAAAGSIAVGSPRANLCPSHLFVLCNLLKHWPGSGITRMDILAASWRFGQCVQTTLTARLLKHLK